ncbi:hypothetical protein BC835DRAFT_1413872 [Cytidiella melzeri]|nr:hypothetical protein BC835DRAFT_1413872 [Cytidiella melzeri]
MASSAAQMRALTIVSYVVLGVLFTAAMLLALWARSRRIQRHRTLRATLAHAEVAPGTGSDTSGNTCACLPTVETDPFQTPADDQTHGIEPPEWAIQYQRYLESDPASQQPQTTSALQSGLPTNSYPRGLGILMKPEH